MSTAEASMSGTVTDKTTGDPLSNISVAIFNNSTNQKLTGTTDSTGAYSIQSIPVGTYDVEVEGDDYGATDVNDLSLPAGNTVKNFTMSKGGSIPGVSTGSGSTKFLIKGTVVQGESTETGMEGGTIVLQPAENIAGATITVTNLNTGAVLGTTTSDSNGNFSIEVPAVSNQVIAKKNGTIYATDNLTEEAIGGGVIDSETVPL